MDSVGNGSAPGSADDPTPWSSTELAVSRRNSRLKPLKSLYPGLLSNPGRLMLSAAA